MENFDQLDLWNKEPEFAWEEFRVAREFARSLKLGSEEDWKDYVYGGKAESGIDPGKRANSGKENQPGKGPDPGKGTELDEKNIPRDPDRVYHNHGWKGWRDWLGIEEPGETKGSSLGKRSGSPSEPDLNSLFDEKTDGLSGDQAIPRWMNFHDARKTARVYGFEYKEEWELLCRGKFPGRESLPENIPENPDGVYRYTGWKGWRDWLRDPEKVPEYTGFQKAREFVHSCRITGKEDWRDFLKDDAGPAEEYGMVLPLRPELEYEESGWVDWEDWLATGIEFHDFSSTRKFVRSLRLRNEAEWRDFCMGCLSHKPKKAKTIYSYPEIAFRSEGWKGWKDWLGGGSSGDVDLH